MLLVGRSVLIWLASQCSVLGGSVEDLSVGSCSGVDGLVDNLSVGCWLVVGSR